MQASQTITLASGGDQDHTLVLDGTRRVSKLFSKLHV